MTNTNIDLPWSIARAAAEAAAIRAALAPYRAKTLRTAAGDGRHVFQLGQLLSLCGMVTASPLFPLSGLPDLDVHTVTCLACLRVLTARLT